jgi:hypothetical protein
MPTFDLSGGGRIYRTVEENAKPVANCADDVKVTLARYFSNPRILHRLAQNEAVMKYD